MERGGGKDGAEPGAGKGVCQSWEGSSISYPPTSGHPSGALIHLSTSTRTCASEIAGTGPRRPNQALGQGTNVPLPGLPRQCRMQP